LGEKAIDLQPRKQRSRQVLAAVIAAAVTILAGALLIHGAASTVKTAAEASCQALQPNPLSATLRTLVPDFDLPDLFGKKVSLLVVPAGDVFAALAQGANSLEVDSVVSGVSSSMTPEDQAFHMGQAWEALPEPKRQFNYYVVPANGEVKVFYIGPHAPSLSPDDVQLVHRLWLNMRRDPAVQDLHHSDIITYALTRLAGQYAREKVEIVRDLRNLRAASMPDAPRLSTPTDNAAVELPQRAIRQTRDQ